MPFRQLSKTWYILPSVTVEVEKPETLYLVSIAVYIYDTFCIEGRSLSSESSTED